MEIRQLDNIQIYDNFFSIDDWDFIEQYCFSASYFYGETDTLNKTSSEYCIGMIHEIFNFENEYYQSDEYKNTHTYILYQLFHEKISQNLSDMKLNRMYINCFAPSENPYFHIDSIPGNLTFLYYPNKTWEIDEGGETQFYAQENQYFYGVLPLPNRLVEFDSSIIHKATTFRNRHRFTIAIKYIKN